MSQKAFTKGRGGAEHMSGCTVMPLAVVGMAFRGPGDASNVDNLYRLLAEAREAWSPIPESRWRKDAFYHPDPARNGTVSKWLDGTPTSTAPSWCHHPFKSIDVNIRDL